MTQKRLWQEPVVKSIEQLPTAYGMTCSSGTTATGGGVIQCNAGGNAKPANCAVGGAATGSCLNGGNGRA
jgi:hypothetical protein